MAVAAHGWRVAPGTLCRVFDDGLAVYVPVTCETHVLPREWLHALSAVQGAPQALIEAEDATETSESALALTAGDWQVLVDRKILDAST